MTQSISDSIRLAVEQHYSKSDGVLLLADLGNTLRENGSWPPPDDQRPLAKFVEELAPEIVLIRDPEVVAYVAVVPAGKEQLVKDTIERRRKTHLLGKLPRPVLLAFCLKTDQQAVYVRTTAPYRYHIGETAEAGFVVVEERYRLPGLYISDPRSLSVSDAIALVEKIEDWATQHNIPLERFYTDGKARLEAVAPVVATPKKDTNALERLYAAQPHGLAAQMVMPFDIAVYLSRLP